MKTLIINDWHFWQDNDKYFASDESCKQLFEFNSFDSMVNKIYVCDRNIAIELNKKWNENNS